MTKERVHFFDNLKGILIFLVVFGHFALPVHSASDTLNALYGFIYIFHMPLFVFVSGFFAKSIVKNGRLRIEKNHLDSRFGNSVSASTYFYRTR